MGQNPLIFDISQIYKEDEELVGKKAHELGTLWKLGIPLPNGFVITAEFFKEFLRLADIDKKIYKSPSLKHPALSDSINNLLQEQIIQIHIPQELALELHHYYKHLSGLFKNRPLNIYSSSSNNKLVSFSNIKGDANLILKIKEIWSMYLDKPVAIIVQENPKPEIKGKISTNILIFDKNLSSKQIEKLTLYCKIIQRYFYFPQEIEYIISKGSIFITKLAPSTGAVARYLNQAPINKSLKKILTRGISINPGIVTGKVKILGGKYSHIEIHKGDIVIIDKLNRPLFRELKNAKGVVVDSAMLTSQDKALFRNNFHFPAIEGAENATKIFHNGNIVTVNGSNGEVFSGGLLN